MPSISQVFGYQRRVYCPEVVAKLKSTAQATVIEQLYYWLDPGRSTKEHDGHRWVYKTYEEWGSELGLTVKQARSALVALRTKGLVVSIRNPNRGRGYDQTLWWRIDVKKFEEYMNS